MDKLGPHNFGTGNADVGLKTSLKDSAIGGIFIHPPTALIVATMDTKGQEALYLVDCLNSEGVSVKIMDAGIRGICPTSVDINREKVAQAAGKSLMDVQNIEFQRI